MSKIKSSLRGLECWCQGAKNKHLRVYQMAVSTPKKGEAWVGAERG